MVLKKPDFTRSMRFFQHDSYRCCVASLFFVVIAVFAKTADGTTAVFPEWDPSREQTWADQVTTHLRVGEIVWLPSSIGNFLALSVRAVDRGANHGALILLPAPDTHPDSDPISTLRTALPLHGWYTLAIQLPAPLVDSRAADYVLAIPSACARLQEAIAWFNRQLISNVIVLGHGLGAAVAAACVVDIAQKGSVQGIILLGAGGTGKLPTALDTTASLEKITLPILDIYSDTDRLAVQSAREREAGRRHRRQPYVQAALPGTGYSFAGAEDLLVARIAAWLNRYVSGEEHKGGE